MRSFSRRLVPLLAVLPMLAGCGGGSHHAQISKAQTTASQTTTTAAAADHCTPGNEAMQCILAQQPAPPESHAPQSQATAPTLQGVDFAWTKLAPSTLKANGWHFGASYLSFDPSKNWNAPLITAYHAAGLGTVAVWETTASRASQGCAAGASDARSGEALLAGWGFPRSHEDLAIDFDASGPDVAAYFRCASQAEPGLVGAYGGYRPLAYLCANHIASLNWQTYAWSKGAWLPRSCAPLEQDLNGLTFDHDRALASNYGQFPSPVVKPAGPSEATLTSWRKARNLAFNLYHAKRCARPQGDVYCEHFGGQIVANQTKLWTAVPRWPCFGAHATKADLNTYVCWVVRPQVSYWSHARASTEKAYFLNGCDGPVSFPRPVHSRLCNVLRQRQNYFAAKATATVRAYSRV